MDNPQNNLTSKHCKTSQILSSHSIAATELSDAAMEPIELAFDRAQTSSCPDLCEYDYGMPPVSML